ncbi:MULTISPECIES: aldo/keto reductase [unclassified Sphingobium]|uniref:aldo/keto reductase n=1 Tax=unclassified Sphingobium TaxID=2611147 RepID=UPI00119A1F2F|nr:aryl-alcohol dehydrogenase-like predicted oxidoreductase [Sphingobium sp. JAI105]TWD05725.1 aryl-alcohol dehydrogenase-like predicted oxidoreductase [Sphingobium sp. AEW010]TWD23278.1 aryl-alcohol dehydrogenase-like predicted oxidoreductase [Sphingobium sp. AEW013]TWD25138.1 aryl-alcohol dehydrogenase-like predicted oxidoreductase [Sphingobium sp. AEW001]
MTFGEDWGWGASVAESREMLDCYIDRGGNIVDTADGYTLGHSEAIIGDYLRERPGRRDRLVLSTKGGMCMAAGDPNAGGASAKTLVRACEQSLRRLGTDYIDLYWMHQPDPFTPIEETLRALDDLVRAGKIRYVGFSDAPAWRTARAQTLAELRGWAPVVALQFEYSLLERSVEHELLPMARELGIGVMPWSTLKAGILSGKYADPAASAQGRARKFGMAIGERESSVAALVGEVAADLGTTSAAIAIAWVMARQGVTSVLMGASSRAQLESNFVALDVTIPQEHLARLDALSAPADIFVSSYARTALVARQNGCTVNGVTAPASPYAPARAGSPY